MPHKLEVPDFNNTRTAFEYLDDRQLYRAWLLFRSMGWPLLVKSGTGMLKAAFSMKLPVKGLVRDTLFAHFCGGETIESALPKRQLLEGYGVGTILDFSVEGKEEESDFDRTCAEILRTIEASSGKILPFAVFKVSGIARFSLLEKLTLGGKLSPEEDREWERVRVRVRNLCKSAATHQVSLLVDAEESWIQGAIDNLTEEMMEAFNGDQARIYQTLQMYRHDRLAYLRGLIKRAKEQQWFPAVKLVRGAYMEKERARARQQGTESPIYPDKNKTDQAYDQALDIWWEERDRMALFAGTHNENSCHKLAGLLRQKPPSGDDSWPFVVFSQLLGMSDHLSFNLAGSGYRVSKYMPYGPVEEALPYLFRRAEENTSIRGQASRELSLITREIRRRKEFCGRS